METEMKHLGPLFALIVAIGFGVFIYTEYTQKGYTQAERNSMDALVGKNTVYDWDDMPRLSVSDLTVEDLR
jgi:hypothetical protein